jgi:hypothetical protein
MEVNKLRLRFFLKVSMLFILCLFLAWYTFNKNSRHLLSSYFNTRCIDYKQRDVSRNLNDRIVDYSSAAKTRGIKPCKSDAEIRSNISAGRLVKIKDGSLYVVDRMTYSSPCATKVTKILLDEIGERLAKKTSQKGLSGVKFIITSLTRKTESLKSLRRSNKNASENSPHLYGNAFDISYKRFIVRKWILTNCDKKFLKDALGEVIWELNQERKCWATYEKGQSCFHVVAR